MSVFDSPFNQVFHNPFGSPFNGDASSGTTWTPAQWFLSNEQGIWLDPSDFSTMFQDAAGTTPVTALEQSVGRILDKSGRGNHATQPTTASKPKLSARVNRLTYSEDFTAAAWTKIAVTVVANSATASDGSVTADKLVPAATNEDHMIYANAGGVTVAAGQRWTGSVDIKADGYGFCYVEVHGGTANGFCLNLATGAITYASSGLIAGTVEDLGGGWWRANVTADTIAAYVYLQLYPRATAGGGGAWLGDGVNGVLMSRAQLTQSAAATTYQRVNTATDYDSVGFPLYLKFDGVDDFLVTNSIDFTSTDKMTVVAGARKLASAEGVIAELSAQYNLNNGSFNLQSRADPDGVTLFVRGNASTSAVSASAFTTNTPAVVTATSKIAADWLHAISVNAGTPAIASTNVGTGNFGNYPLYIGRRGGVNTPFNGHLYQLIVRGAATADLTPVETFVNSKTGAY